MFVSLIVFKGISGLSLGTGVFAACISRGIILVSFLEGSFINDVLIEGIFKIIASFYWALGMFLSDTNTISPSLGRVFFFVLFVLFEVFSDKGNKKSIGLRGILLSTNRVCNCSIVFNLLGKLFVKLFCTNPISLS